MMRPTRFGLFSIFWLVIAGAATPGCRHATMAQETGASSFTFVGAPSPPPPPQRKARIDTEQPKTSARIVGARPLGTPPAPVYPRAALAKHAGRMLVGVELTIDTEGRVASVAPSLATLSTPGPFAAEFREAVEDAVKTWRFRPAEINHLEVVKDPGGDYLRLASSEKIEWRFDVQFTFSASGEVRPDAAK